VLMISPTANVQSCLQTAQAGNESLCAGYYNLLSSTGVAALCP
jgi:hypothetical protein